MRVSADEQRADAERERLTREALPVLPPAEAAGVDLGPDEWLHAIRRVALLERRQEAQPTGGILFLTSQRLLHVTGEGVEEVPLVKISEMAVAMERLLLIELADGSDLAIEVDQPRLLRVQVSAARAAGRGREE